MLSLFVWLTDKKNVLRSRFLSESDTRMARFVCQNSKFTTSADNNFSILPLCQQRTRVSANRTSNNGHTLNGSSMKPHTHPTIWILSWSLHCIVERAQHSEIVFALSIIYLSQFTSSIGVSATAQCKWITKEASQFVGPHLASFMRCFWWIENILLFSMRGSALWIIMFLLIENFRFV